MQPDKQLLRRIIRQRKQAMPLPELQRRSEILTERFLQTREYRDARTIYGYLPFNQEVRTLPLLQHAIAEGKQVALPKCRGTEMWFVIPEDLNQVCSSPFGAPEPICDTPIANDPTALVLIPGVAFDRQRHRLGYGGGYYDRFLAKEPHHPTIALCFDFQMLPQIPTEPHDISIDTILWV